MSPAAGLVVWSLSVVCVTLCIPLAGSVSTGNVTDSVMIVLPSTQSSIDSNNTVSGTGGDCLPLVVTHGSVRDSSGVPGANGKLNYTAGERLEILCDSSYRFPHIKSSVVHVVCRADGTWTDVLGTAEAPSCERIGGCSVPQVPNGYVIEKADGFMPDDHTTVQCNTGYVLSPLLARPLLRCKVDGTWTAYDVDQISCRDVNLVGCSTPSGISNGGFRMIPSNAYDASRGTWQSGVRAVYYCDDGYRMATDNSSVITCTDGAWHGASGLPSCRLRTVSDRCGPAPDVMSARRFILEDVAEEADRTEAARRRNYETFAHGTKIAYVCDPGYQQNGSPTVMCVKGEWSGHGPRCEQHQLCLTKPPNVTHAEVNIYPSPHDTGAASYGAKAYYFCHTGYRLSQSNVSTLVCNDSNWIGQLPSCVRRSNCDVPMNIENGNWIIESMFADYRIGVRVHYDCESGFNRIGAADIECLASGYWSDYPPKCLVKDEYCSEPAAVPNGFFFCKQSQCDSFRVGTELHYFCNTGYESTSVDPVVRTCLSGGIWTGSGVPTCVAVEVEPPTFYSLYVGQNTMRIIISTTCTILIVLIIILFAVALQHRIHRRRRTRVVRLHEPPMPDCPPAAVDISPPLYTSQAHESDREQDRLALIAFADDMWGTSQPPLPSYEEALQHGGPLYHIGGHASLGLGRCSRIVDLRPMVAAVARDQSTGAVVGDHRRNSIVTNASNNLSAATVGFGSLDTVNNAASDTVSTSVTVDTYDSMASNPSLTASQRAARGSIESSSTRGSLAGEAAPLLEHRGTGTPLAWEHRGANDMPCASDTLRSQTSRSLHSSDTTSRIVELPEDIKDD